MLLCLIFSSAQKRAHIGKLSFVEGKICVTCPYLVLLSSLSSTLGPFIFPENHNSSIASRDHHPTAAAAEGLSYLSPQHLKEERRATQHTQKRKADERMRTKGPHDEEEEEEEEEKCKLGGGKRRTTRTTPQPNMKPCNKCTE